MPASQELSRASIIESYRSRISQDSRIKLYKDEFEFLVNTFVEQLAKANTPRAIEKLCHSEIALLEEGYQPLALASTYIPRYRKAIKDAIATKQIKLTPKNSHTYTHTQRITGIQEKRTEHWAIAYFKYSPEEYEEMDARQAQVNRKKLLNLKAVELERYLHEIELLLESEDKFAARHQAIAIAAVTGRRIGEVLARGTFSLTEHPYLLHFEGQQKHERDGYDIVTLIPAKALLERINTFRAMPEISALLKLNDDDLQEEIKKFGVMVNRECNKRLNLSGIVPPLDGKKTASIHNLRSLWGAIAVYYFCPVHNHEYAFLQHYLGHVLESSATGHYFRYQLRGEDGTLLNDKGVKLSVVPVLPLLDGDEVDAKEAALNLPQTTIEKSSNPLTHDIEQAIAERFSAIQHEWAKYQEALAVKLSKIEYQLSHSTDPNIQENLEGLKTENQRLKTENQQLALQLHEVQAKLEQFRQLLSDDVSAEVEPPIVHQQAIEVDSEPESKPEPRIPEDKAKHEWVVRVNSTPVGRGRRPGKAIRRATGIFYAIQDWNRIHPTDAFAITPGLLETKFGIHRQAAKQFCEDYQMEVWEHHQEIGVESVRVFNRGRNTQALVDFVNEKEKL